jgi:predicted dehydrogenase
VKPLSIALIGAGNRGADVYAEYIRRFPGVANLTMVADPDAEKRARLAERHGISSELQFADWRGMLSEKRADALIIASPDKHHVEPAVRGLELGYPILLEKPIAPTLEGVLQVLEAARRFEGDITISHVLRYSEFFVTIKRLLTAGRIGKLVTIEHTENIGYWHFAHSYVRGNWRKESASSPMILAKSCHDLDILRWLVAEPCLSAYSSGGLLHFREENAPAGSTARCTDGCAVERRCPYSALRIYLERFSAAPGWPNSVLTSQPNPGTILKALETGPYGRCVYRCDNDVADHQVTLLKFEGGVTASLTVSAFTERNTRTVHLMGSSGEIHGAMDTGVIELNDFVHGARETIHVRQELGGHAGADEGLIRAFLEHLRYDHTPRTGLEEAAESHLMAFAAEKSRETGQSVEVGALSGAV